MDEMEEYAKLGPEERALVDRYVNAIAQARAYDPKPGLLARLWQKIRRP